MAVSYFINRKQSICVASFKGTLSAIDVEVLERCANEVLTDNAKYVILNLGGISAVEEGMGRALTIFQQTLRSQSKLLICDVQPDVLRGLKAEGLVRDSEVMTDLMASLQMILSWEKG